MFLIDKVLSAIKEKWLQEHVRKTLYMQQDNAPCHVFVDDEEFCRVTFKRWLQYAFDMSTT